MTATILLLDDDLALLGLTTDILETLGYSVLPANSVSEAVHLIDGGAAFDLLLTDMFLGGSITGVELANRARHLRPGTPVIFISGYGYYASVELEGTKAMLLYKPVSVDVLDAAISSALARTQVEGTSAIKNRRTA